MSKTTITRLFEVAVAAVAGGMVMGLAAAVAGLVNGAVVLGGSQAVTLNGGALAWTNWVAGIVAVYSSLFGIGKLVLGSLVPGLVMLAIAVVAFSWIARSFREEPATLPGVGVPA